MSISGCLPACPHVRFWGFVYMLKYAYMSVFACADTTTNASTDRPPHVRIQPAPPPPPAVLAGMHVEHTAAKIKGAAYQDERIRYVRAGAELFLRRDHRNIHDVNAIVVEGVVRSLSAEPVPLGYVPATLAAKLAPQMDEGRVFRVVYAGGEQMVILTAGDGGELKLTKSKRR